MDCFDCVVQSGEKSDNVIVDVDADEKNQFSWSRNRYEYIYLFFKGVTRSIRGKGEKKTIDCPPPDHHLFLCLFFSFAC